MVLNRYNPLLHRTAVVTTVSTVLLIVMGGLVTSHGAGMSVPDWPNSYGYNMWLFPPSLWWNKGGIFYEHSHRLMATFVGLCSILLVAIAWKTERRKWVRVLCFGVLGLVIFQGVLGGLRVVWVDLKLAVVHGITAQLFFCTAAMAAMATSKWWSKAPNLAWSEDYASGRRLILIAWIAFGCVFGQLVVGAMMRHYQAGLAIPDLPLAYGKVLPPTSADEMAVANNLRAKTFDQERAALIAAKQDERARQLPTDRMTLAQAWLHFGHRMGALLATTAILLLIVKVIRQHDGRRVLLQPAIILGVLLLVQVTLGVYTVIKRKPADIASAHVAVGATVLVFCFMVAVRSMRLYSRRFRNQADSVRVDVKSMGSKGFLVS